MKRSAWAAASTLLLRSGVRSQLAPSRTASTVSRASDASFGSSMLGASSPETGSWLSPANRTRRVPGAARRGLAFGGGDELARDRLGRRAAGADVNDARIVVGRAREGRGRDERHDGRDDDGTEHPSLQRGSLAHVACPPEAVPRASRGVRARTRTDDVRYARQVSNLPPAD